MTTEPFVLEVETGDESSLRYRYSVTITPEDERFRIVNGFVLKTLEDGTPYWLDNKRRGPVVELLAALDKSEVDAHPSGEPFANVSFLTGMPGTTTERNPNPPDEEVGFMFPEEWIEKIREFAKTLRDPDLPFETTRGEGDSAVKVTRFKKQFDGFSYTCIDFDLVRNEVLIDIGMMRLRGSFADVIARLKSESFADEAGDRRHYKFKLRDGREHYVPIPNAWIPHIRRLFSTTW